MSLNDSQQAATSSNENEELYPAPQSADKINELVEASLLDAFNDSLNAKPITFADVDMPGIDWDSLKSKLPSSSEGNEDLKPAMNIPDFFPSNFFKPFTIVPEPDKDGATAQFENTSDPDNVKIRPADTEKDTDPLVVKVREQMRKLYPSTSERELDVLVNQFMANLQAHGPLPLGSMQYTAMSDKSSSSRMENEATLKVLLNNGTTEALNSIGTSLMEPREILEGRLDDALFEEFADLLGYQNEDPLLELGNDFGELGDDFVPLEEPIETDLFDERHDLSLSAELSLDAMDPFKSAMPIRSDANDSADVELELEQALQDAYGDELDDLIGLDPACTPYKFEVRDSSEHSAAKLLQAGSRLHEAGKLYAAMDALEAALKQPTEGALSLEEPELMRAWYLLGSAHLENGDDVRAIQALSHVSRVEAPPDALPGLIHPTHIAGRAALLLACAYANEMDGDRAQTHLRKWLALQNEQYGNGDEGDEEIDDDVDEVIDAIVGVNADVNAFVSANKGLVRRLERIAEQHAGNADALCAVAIAKGLADGASAPVSELHAATKVAPTDAILWARLGDALGAAGAVDDSILVLRRAADLRPEVARSWLRVGVAHLSTSPNIAVRYFLRALDIARVAPRAQAHREAWRAAWTHVKAALYAIGRPELVSHADERNIEEFRAHFVF